MKKYDITIIGAGPGGYIAAIRATQLGGRVCVIEKEHLGGTCLNRGCIPTKALLKSAELFYYIQNAGSLGIKVQNITPDVPLIFERKEKIIQQLRKGIETLFKVKKIDVIKGVGKVVSASQVLVNEEEKISSKFIILATGSESLACPGIETDGKNILTSTDILNTASIPKSLVIIGGGVIGCEMACFYSQMGSKVHMIEMTDRALPTEDIEVSKTFLTFLKKRTVEVHLSTKVISASVKNKDETIVNLEGGDIIAEKVLVCIGRRPNSENIGIEEMGIKTEKSRPVVDEYMRTNISTIFAIGDLAGKRYLAHTASMEGIVAVENAVGKDGRMDYSVVPNCIWTFPEISSVGLNIEQALFSGIDAESSKFPFQALGRAVASSQTQGFVKIVFDKKTREVLGCQIIGPCATELIAEVSLAIRMQATVKDIANTIHAHPTFSEAIQEAAYASLEGALHLP